MVKCEKTFGSVIKMKKVILLSFILISGLLLTVACGGGGGHSGYGKKDEPVYELKVNKEGGIDAKTFSGITVSADKDTFANNQNITVYLTEEKDIAGVNSLFKVASKCYTLRASTGDGVKVIEVFKPLKLSIQHNATANSDIFVGVKTTDDWHYNCVSSSLVTNFRAAKTSEIEYGLYKLPSTVAVFAYDNSKKLDVPAIMGVEANKVVVPSKSGRFIKDGEMVLTVSGINLEKTTAKDIQVILAYESGNKNSKITINGAASTSAVSSAEQGSGNSYVHTVTINDISKFDVVGTDITLRFTLGASGTEVLWAPGRFNIEVRNDSKSEKFKILPFCVSTTAVLINDSQSPISEDVPVPTDVTAKYYEDTKTVSASWKWSGTDNKVNYTVKIVNLSVEDADTYVFGDIEGTDWRTSKLTLANGKYAIRVMAVTSKGMSLESEQKDSSVFIVNNSGPKPTPVDVPTPKNVLAKYDENTRTVSASWEWSGTDKVEYMVKVINLSSEKADTYVFGDIESKDWSNSKLGLEKGKYAIKVVAVTSKGMSSESEQTDNSVFIVNTSGPTPTPDIPTPENVLAKYDENTKTVSASWKWSGTDKNVEYMVKVINQSVEKADTYVLGNIKNTEWETSKLGLENGKYAIKVLAVTSKGMSPESEQTDKSVFVVNNVAPSIPTPKNVVTKYNENTKIVSLTWEWEGTDKDVEYSVKIINTDNSVAGNYNFLGIKTTSWDSGKSILALPAGDYDVLVSALTASGTSKASDSTEKSKFKVITPIWIDSLTLPVVKIEPSEYDYDSDVTITWSPSRILSVNGTKADIKYTVYANLGKQPETVIATETSELQCVIHNTLAGTYLVKVVASANDLTSTSEIVSFNVKQPYISKPVITSSQYMALNGSMYIEWQPVENAMSYNVYIYPSNLERKDTPQGSINIAFDDKTSYSASDDIKEKGIYNIVVEALNKQAKIFSDVQTVKVDYAPSLARNLSFDISEGRPVVVSWDEDYWKAPDVSYSINVYKNKELIIKESTNKLSWVCNHYLEPGLYDLNISAENIFGPSGISYNEIEVPVFSYPTDVKMLDAYTGNKQSITWKAGNDAPDVIYSYRLLKDNKVIISSSSTELVCYTDQYLDAGSYKFEISAKNDWGQSATATYDLKVLENNIKIKAPPTIKSDIADVVFDYTMTQEVKDFIVANIGVASETIERGGYRELKTSWLASQTLALHNPYGLKVGSYPVCLKDEKVELLKKDYKITFLKASDNKCIEIINDGSVEHPYLVYDAESLDMIREVSTIKDQYNMPHFKQTNDIDLSGYINEHYTGINGSSWEPIGQSDYADRVSLGYDGAGYKITGLKIKWYNQYAGLFGCLGPNSYVKNLKIERAEVEGRNFVGAIIGYAYYCGIENCCMVDSTITGEYRVGGLTGESHNYTDLIKNCYVTNSKVSGIRFIGGICGDAYSGKVMNSYAANTTVGFSKEASDNGRIGVLVGYPDFNCRVYNSFAAGYYEILNASGTASASMHICGGLGPICCYGLDKGYVASPTGELVWNTGWPDDTQSTTFKADDGGWWDSRYPWENCATSPWIIPTGTFTKDKPCLPKLSTINDDR